MKFETGTTYYARSICDHNCIYQMTVIGRTAKTIKVQIGGNIKTLRPAMSVNGHEMVKPNGSYSMCLIIDASDTKVLKPDWELKAIRESVSQRTESPAAIH